MMARMVFLTAVRFIASAFSSAAAATIAVVSVGLYLALGTWSVSVVSTQFIGHPLHPWWVNTLLGIVLMGPCLVIALVVAVSSWLGALISSGAHETASTTLLRTVVVATAHPTFPPGMSADERTCIAASVARTISADALYTTCIRSAQKWQNRASASTRIDDNDEYSANVALFEQYAAGGAYEKHDQAEFQRLRSESLAIWTRLQREGYNKAIRARAGRLIKCFYVDPKTCAH